MPACRSAGPREPSGGGSCGGASVQLRLVPQAAVRAKRRARDVIIGKALTVGQRAVAKRLRKRQPEGHFWVPLAVRRPGLSGVTTKVTITRSLWTSTSGSSTSPVTPLLHPTRVTSTSSCLDVGPTSWPGASVHEASAVSPGNAPQPPRSTPPTATDNRRLRTLVGPRESLIGSPWSQCWRSRAVRTCPGSSGRPEGVNATRPVQAWCEVRLAASAVPDLGRDW